MKNETVNKAMQDIDDRLIDRCGEIRTASGAPAKNVYHPIYDFVKGAACFLLCGALVFGIMMLPKKKNDGGAAAPSGEYDTKRDIADSGDYSAEADAAPGTAKLWGAGVISFRFIHPGSSGEPGVTYIRDRGELEKWLSASLAADFPEWQYIGEIFGDRYFDMGGGLVVVDLYTESGMFLLQPASAEISQDGVLHIAFNKYVGKPGTCYTEDIGFYTAVIAIDQPIADVADVTVRNCEEDPPLLLRALRNGDISYMHIGSLPEGYDGTTEDRAFLFGFSELLQKLRLLPYDDVSDLAGCTYVLDLKAGGQDFRIYDICGTEILCEYNGMSERYTLSESDGKLLDTVISALLAGGDAGKDTTPIEESAPIEDTTPIEESAQVSSDTEYAAWGTEQVTEEYTGPYITDYPVPDVEFEATYFFRGGVFHDGTSVVTNIFRDYDSLKNYYIACVGEDKLYTDDFTEWYSEYIAPAEQALKNGAVTVIVEMCIPSYADEPKLSDITLENNGVLDITVDLIGPETNSKEVSVWTAVITAYGKVSHCDTTVIWN